MGASKVDFMNDREEEFFATDKPTVFNPFEQLSDMFVTQAEEYESGNIDALETALKMRKTYERLEIQMNNIKSWIEENKEAIDSEASKYPEGFKGYKVLLQTRTTLNFKNIPEWAALENAKKEFEARSKAALEMVKKGGLNVDADGAEIPLPEQSVTSFIKFDKIKK